MCPLVLSDDLDVRCTVGIKEYNCIVVKIRTELNLLNKNNYIYIKSNRINVGQHIR